MADRRRDRPVILRGILATRPSTYARRSGPPQGLRQRLSCVLERGTAVAWTGLIHLLLLALLAEVAWVILPEREESVLLVGLHRTPAAPAPVPPPRTDPAPPRSPKQSGPTRPVPTVASRSEPEAAPISAETSPVERPPVRSAPVASGPATLLPRLGEADRGTGLARGLGEVRSFEARRTALLKYGGTEASEDAVRLGLQWLAVHQSGDGRWSANGFSGKCPRGSGCGIRKGDPEADAGVTGLALLAFLGAGHAAGEGPYGETVRSGVEWLMGRQDPSGFFFEASKGRPPTAGMYGHGICAYALAEAHALRPDPRTATSLRRALEATARAQKSYGGWNYTTDPSDAFPEVTLSVWQILALHAARRAGVEPPPGTLERAASFLARQARSDGGVRYATDEATPGATAGAWFARSVLGSMRDGAFDRGMDYLDGAFEAATPDPADPRTWGGLYTWYYRTLATFRHQGRRWRDWNRVIRPFLVSLQRTRGCAAGSWIISDQRMGGTVYATAMCVMTLEVYYRYPPRDGAPTPLEVVRLLTDRAPGGPTDVERSRMARLRPETPDEAGDRRERVRRKALADLSSDRPERRYVAARVLSESGDPGVLELMIRAADRERGRLKGAHLRFIARVKHPDVVPYLVRQADDPDPEVRRAALEAMRIAAKENPGYAVPGRTGETASPAEPYK